MPLRDKDGAVVVSEAPGDGHEELVVAAVAAQPPVELAGDVKLPHVLGLLDFQHDIWREAREKCRFIEKMPSIFLEVSIKTLASF